MENVLATLKRREVVLTSNLFDLLHRAVDTLDNLLMSIDMQREPSEKTYIKNLINGLIEDLKRSLDREGADAFPDETVPFQAQKEVKFSKQESPDVREERSPSDTVRISAGRLNSILLQAEEMLSAKLATDQICIELKELMETLSVLEREYKKVRTETRHVRKMYKGIRQHSSHTAYPEKGRHDRKSPSPHIMKVLEYHEWNHSHVKEMDQKISALTRSAASAGRSLGAMLSSLLGDMKKVLMLPFSTLLGLFPKMVRDLARDCGKEVELNIHGGEIEIDRRILDEIKTPLIHLLRNCIDYGIEEPHERLGDNKPPRGILSISLSRMDSGRIEIIVADDGSGIDIEQVKSTVVKRGIVSREELAKLTEQDILELVFRSGVTTNPVITDLSGRGLGLAIVKEKVEKLGGNIFIRSEWGTGTTFTITLPLTISTFRSVLFRLGDYTYAMPTLHIERVMRVKTSEIKTIKNRDTIMLGKEAVPLHMLGDVIQMQHNTAGNESQEFIHIIIADTGEKSMAFVVDEILHEQEVLVKDMGKQISRVRNIAGATVLGTGKVVPILNVPDLLTSAAEAAAGAGRTIREGAGQDEETTKSILLVEDSITARTLLKNILESAGYNVKAAVDGVDAYTALRTDTFDLVISDVEMPRMNGFDLTAKIRAESQFRELPVILVTALESREDRERGIDAGANAYIVKSSFDQSNLLEVVKRLL
jgi:two-component system chemotaxis sensor kinase CheA